MPIFTPAVPDMGQPQADVAKQRITAHFANSLVTTGHLGSHS